VVLHVAPSFGVGGAQVRFAQLANHFGLRQRHVAIALDGEYGACDLVNGEVPLQRLQAAAGGLGALHRLRGVIAAVRPDILATYNWGSIEWACANRLLPVVPRHLHFEDGFGPEESGRQLPRRVWFRRLALSGRHTHVIVPSQVLYELATKTWRLDAGRVHYVPNGIDLGRFRLGGADRAEPPPGGFAVGTVARLRPEKNLGRLIGAVARLAPALEARLLIAGDGQARGGLEARARALGIADRVHFLGMQPQPERVLQQLHVFALSSDTEQMPISVVEAMACGLPVASTDVGDIHNMLAPANAALVRGCRDEESLAEQLRRMAEQPELRGRLGQENADKARREFDETVMFRRYEELFGTGRSVSRAA